ncbi:MAG: MinD/ParA family protein [Anaerolineales bacterium]|nr:MinD/ParA family protein [Anaerolineales bacterium]
MSKFISIHSFRGGTGKSNTTANIAALLANKGLKVGVVDSDIQSPGIHILFGIRGEDVKKSLNDYLWGHCTVAETAHDVTAQLGMGITGKVYLVPSSMDTNNIARVLREGYDISLMRDGLYDLAKELKLDVLLIDTHPGLNEETLLSIALSDFLLIIMRPDAQDYEGTAVTVSIAKRLQVPEINLVVNKVPPQYDMAHVKKQVQDTYDVNVAAIIPHSDDLMGLASQGIFAIQHPQHPITALYQQIVDLITT